MTNKGLKILLCRKRQRAFKPSVLILYALFSADLSKVQARITQKYDAGAFFANAPSNGLSSSSGSEFIHLHQYTLGINESAGSRLSFKSNLSLFFFMTSENRSIIYNTLTTRESFSRSEHVMFRLIYEKDMDLFFDTNETYVSLFGDAGLLKIGRFPINFSRMFFFSPNNIFSPPTALDRLTGTKSGSDGLSYEMSISNKATVTAGVLAGWKYEEESAESDTSATEGATETESTDSLFPQEADDNPDEPPKRNAFESKLSSAFVNVSSNIADGQTVDFLLAKYAYFTLLGASLQSQSLKKVGIRAEGHYRISNEEFDKNSMDAAVGFETKPSRTTLVQGEYFFHESGGGSTKDYFKNQSAIRMNNSSYLAKHYMSFFAQKQMYSFLSFDSLTLLNLVDFSILETLSAIRTIDQNFEVVGRLSLPLLGKSASFNDIGSEFQLYPTTLSVELHAAF